MSKKKKSFFRSQSAHRRLMRKHYDGRHEKTWIPYNYHSAVMEKQKKENRVLTIPERQKIFKTTESYFYS